MAGVTDAPFRRLCREYGESGLPDRWFENHVPTPRIDAPSGLYVMEMVTSRAFVEGSARTFDMLRPDPAERVRSVQLYGVNPTVMAQAARLLVDQDLADHIDLNFGCPVPKVTRKGGGAALPWKKDLFTDLVTSVVRATESASVHRDVTVPVTIKMRIGIDEEHHTYMDAARIAEKAGVAAVALHARTQTQHYSGKARWEHIARLKDRLKIPVLGNGDVFSGADALAMMNDTGCDAVVVGRGCQGRPWIFRDLVRALHGLPELQGPTLRQVATIIEKHAQWVVEKENDEFRALREMRKHVGWYLRGFAIGGPIRGALNKVSSLGELHERLHALDLDQPFPKAAQGPRGRAGGEKTPHLPDGWLDSPYLTPAQKEQLHLAEDGADGG
ncbi:tRNA dihydrouridine synthase DusB [Schaalia sp. lx-100]|nr:tRNA dihydrouridine synthase DusB [Schaalia sp. lx-100]